MQPFPIKTFQVGCSTHSVSFYSEIPSL